MGLFKSKYERELETFIARINMKMSTGIMIIGPSGSGKTTLGKIGNICVNRNFILQ